MATDAPTRPPINFESQFVQPKDEEDELEEDEPQEMPTFNLGDFVVDGDLVTLENCVQRGAEYLEDLKQPLKGAADGKECAHWLKQINDIQSSAERTRTIIGVVGNTGAGKSSVINALLDEERIVPTNTMRACTAVITELSYNYDGDDYKAEIEFVTADEWRKELKILFDEMMNGEGSVSRSAGDESSEAGIAFATIRSVYPQRTKENFEDLANDRGIEQLMRELDAVLGSTKKFRDDSSLTFYRQLQSYIDSKEKNKDKNGEFKNIMVERELWPLIKVVRLQIRSAALSTGAVIVDLPGAHDSNAARSAIAEKYMRQCTGLWIVAPIIRAVDDKTAKTLMGDTFKRQLKMDGGFNSVTFICSKIVDISITEASDSLNLGVENGPRWERIETLKREADALERKQQSEKEDQEGDTEKMMDLDEQIEIWEELLEKVEDGQTVYAPVQRHKRSRKRSSSTDSSPRARKRQRRDVEDEDGDYQDSTAGDDDVSDKSTGDDDHATSRDPLSEDEVKEKVAHMKSEKKAIRARKTDVRAQRDIIEREIDQKWTEINEVEAEIATLCIEGRNKYSADAVSTCGSTFPAKIANTLPVRSKRIMQLAFGNWIKSSHVKRMKITSILKRTLVITPVLRRRCRFSVSHQEATRNFRDV